MKIFGIPQEIWLPITTLVLGALLKTLNDIFIDVRKTKKNSKEKAYTIKIKSIQLKKENLNRLEEKLNILLRIMGRFRYQSAISQYQKIPFDWKDMKENSVIDAWFYVYQMLNFANRGIKLSISQEATKMNKLFCYMLISQTYEEFSARVQNVQTSYNHLLDLISEEYERLNEQEVSQFEN